MSRPKSNSCWTCGDSRNFLSGGETGVSIEASGGSAVLHGSQPRPRVVLSGDFSGTRYSTDLVLRLRGRIPSVRVENWLARVDLSEYDCLVTSEMLVDLDDGVWRQVFPPHLCIILILVGENSSSVGLPMDAWNGAGDAGAALVVHYRQPGREVIRPSTLTDGQDSLVRSAISVLRSRQWREEVEHIYAPRGLAEVLRVRPLLQTPSGRYLAGRYERNEQASVWFLPDGLPDLDEWILAALDEWHGQYPERFPDIPTWDHDREWMTAAERDLANAIDQREAVFRQAERDFETLQAEDRSGLERLRVVADEYPRRLLTGQGRDLVLAVARFLADCGFQVRDMDLEYPPDAQREDLRLSVPESRDWEAIVEVKGLKKGVNQDAFTQLDQHAAHYLAEEDRPPSAQWYVANPFRNHAPDRRQRYRRADTLAVLEQKNGLYLDTRDLFEIARRLDEGTLDPARIRSALVGAVGGPTFDDLFPSSPDAEGHY